MVRFHDAIISRASAWMAKGCGRCSKSTHCLHCCSFASLQALTLHTSAGDIKIELACSEAPKNCEVSRGSRRGRRFTFTNQVVCCFRVARHSASSMVELFMAELQNFMMHAAMGTYSGTYFHRVFPGFMAQAGDPTGTGKGGEAAHGGFIPDEYTASLRHSQRGVLSMAKPHGTSKNGSQFFITFGPQAHLDGQYTVIGCVIGGMDALSAIEDTPVTRKGRPLTEGDRVVIAGATIHANPFADA